MPAEPGGGGGAQTYRRHSCRATLPLAKFSLYSQLRQYLYFCTSKASKLSTASEQRAEAKDCFPQLRQYLYFYASKASKVSTASEQRAEANDRAGDSDALRGKRC